MDFSKRGDDPRRYSYRSKVGAVVRLSEMVLSCCSGFAAWLLEALLRWLGSDSAFGDAAAAAGPPLGFVAAPARDGG